jgi:hypothetical protein
MDERQYWYLAVGDPGEIEDYMVSDSRGIFAETARQWSEEKKRWVARRARQVSVLSIPWWPEAVKWGHKDGIERVDAPMLFTTREAAEEKLREIQDAEADNYLSLVDHHGEGIINVAYNNTAPLQVFDLDESLLLGKLEESDFLYVMVDGNLKLRRDFMEDMEELSDT